LGIDILDAMAPRPPVFSAANAMDTEQSICLRWTRNTEHDLNDYDVYSTTDPANLSSKRRMVLILTNIADGRLDVIGRQRTDRSGGTGARMRNRARLEAPSTG